MSDSEDAFQSADEGAEGGSSEVTPTSSPRKEEANQSKSGAKKESSKSGKGKGRNKRQNKKSKGSSSSSEPSKPASKPEEPEKTSVTEKSDEPVTDMDKLTITEKVETEVLCTESKDNEVKEDAKKDASKPPIESSNDESDSTKATEPDEVKSGPSDNSGANSEETSKDIEMEKKQEFNAKSVFDRLSEDTTKNSGGGGWGWGSWGSSILNTASSSVTTLTSTVGEGMKAVGELVESGLGAPDPDELARIEQERRAAKDAERQKRDEVETQDMDHANTTKEETEPAEMDEASCDETSQGGGASWLPTWGVDSITSVVKKTADVVHKVGDTSKHLVDGTLDVMENIGKKTYEALAEGDHGIKKLRKDGGTHNNLSEMLREAAKEAEEKAKQEEEFVESLKSNFSAQFDDHQGLVQLEALEMLSNQCEGRVHNMLGSLPSDDLTTAKASLVAIKDACQLGDLDEEEDEADHDFSGLMKENVGQLGLNTNPDKLIEVQEKARLWLVECQKDQSSGTKPREAGDIHQTAIQSLASITAAAVTTFHKVGQLCLADANQSQPAVYKTRAECMASVTKTLCAEVGMLSSRFSECLNTAADDSEDPDSINPLMTSVYLEATNSSTYIQDAFQLLLPVFQQAALDSTASASS